MSHQNCTELAVLPLVAGTDITNQAGDAQKILQEVLAILSTQPGFRGAFYGHQVENAENLTIALEWNEIDDHKKFTKTEAHRVVEEKLGSIMAGPPTTGPYHIIFASAFASVVNAPVVEMLTLYFTTSVDQESFEKTWKSFAQVADENAKGYVGSTTGWVVEALEHEKVVGKAKGFSAVIGWESVNAHMKYRDTEAFKGSIRSLREAATALSVYHVKYTQAV